MTRTRAATTHGGTKIFPAENEEKIVSSLRVFEELLFLVYISLFIPFTRKVCHPLLLRSISPL